MIKISGNDQVQYTTSKHVKKLDIRMEQKSNNTSSQMLLDHCYRFGLLLWLSNPEEVVLWRSALIDLLWPCPGSTAGRIWPKSQYKCAGVISTPKCL